MRGINLQTAHRKSHPGATSQFGFFDLMFIITENPSSHFHVEGKSVAVELLEKLYSVEYEEAIINPAKFKR